MTALEAALPFDPHAPVRDALIGTVVGDRYLVQGVLGQGGMGIVYEAEQTNLRRRVAIKCLHVAWSRRPEVVARFQQEALAATRAKNPHVVEVFDLGRLPDGTLYIAMEFLEGQELSKALRGGPMSVGRAVSIATQLCDALIDVHAQGIVHRDLKPDNVFLTRDGAQADFVKVLDFGISKVRAEDGAAEITNSQATLGTPSYMAPEQFGDARHVDHTADLYAVGGILYRALAGRTPFEAKDLPTLVIQVTRDPPPDLSTWRTDLPPPLVTLIHRCLEKQPAQRPQSARALRESLAPFAGIDEPPQLSLHALEARRLDASPITPPSPAHGAPRAAERAATEWAAPPPAVTPPTPPAVVVQTSEPQGRLMMLVIAMATVVVCGGLGVAALALWRVRPPAPLPAPVTQTTAAPAALERPMAAASPRAPDAGGGSTAPGRSPDADVRPAGRRAPRPREAPTRTLTPNLIAPEASPAPVEPAAPPRGPGTRAPLPPGVGLVHTPPATPF